MATPLHNNSLGGGTYIIPFAAKAIELLTSVVDSPIDQLPQLAQQLSPAVAQFLSLLTKENFGWHHNLTFRLGFFSMVAALVEAQNEVSAGATQLSQGTAAGLYASWTDLCTAVGATELLPHHVITAEMDLQVRIQCALAYSNESEEVFVDFANRFFNTDEQAVPSPAGSENLAAKREELINAFRMHQLGAWPNGLNELLQTLWKLRIELLQHMPLRFDQVLEKEVERLQQFVQAQQQMQQMFSVLHGAAAPVAPTSSGPMDGTQQGVPGEGGPDANSQAEGANQAMQLLQQAMHLLAQQGLIIPAAALANLPVIPRSRSARGGTAAKPKVPPATPLQLSWLQGQKIRRKTHKWGAEDEAALKEYCLAYIKNGERPSWKHILLVGQQHGFFDQRTNVDLKDKWRLLEAKVQPADLLNVRIAAREEELKQSVASATMLPGESSVSQQHQQHQQQGMFPVPSPMTGSGLPQEQSGMMGVQGYEAAQQQGHGHEAALNDGSVPVAPGDGMLLHHDGVGGEQMSEKDRMAKRKRDAMALGPRKDFKAEGEGHHGESEGEQRGEDGGPQGSSEMLPGMSMPVQHRMMGYSETGELDASGSSKMRNTLVTGGNMPSPGRSQHVSAIVAAAEIMSQCLAQGASIPPVPLFEVPEASLLSGLGGEHTGQQYQLPRHRNYKAWTIEEVDVLKDIIGQHGVQWGTVVQEAQRRGLSRNKMSLQEKWKALKKTGFTEDMAKKAYMDKQNPQHAAYADNKQAMAHGATGSPFTLDPMKIHQQQLSHLLPQSLPFTLDHKHQAHLHLQPYMDRQHSQSGTFSLEPIKQQHHQSQPAGFAMDPTKQPQTLQFSMEAMKQSPGAPYTMDPTKQATAGPSSFMAVDKSQAASPLQLQPSTTLQPAPMTQQPQDHSPTQPM